MVLVNNCGPFSRDVTVLPILMNFMTFLMNFMIFDEFYDFSDEFHDISMILTVLTEVTGQRRDFGS